MGLFLSPLLLATLGWRGLFFVFGVLGLPLLAAWLAIVPKPPQQPGMVKAETAPQEYIGKLPVSPVPEEVTDILMGRVTKALAQLYPKCGHRPTARSSTCSHLL